LGLHCGREKKAVPLQQFFSPFHRFAAGVLGLDQVVPAVFHDLPGNSFGVVQGIPRHHRPVQVRLPHQGVCLGQFPVLLVVLGMGLVSGDGHGNRRAVLVFGEAEGQHPVPDILAVQGQRAGQAAQVRSHTPAQGTGKGFRVEFAQQVVQRFVTGGLVAFFPFLPWPAQPIVLLAGQELAVAPDLGQVGFPREQAHGHQAQQGADRITPVVTARVGQLAKHFSEAVDLVFLSGRSRSGLCRFSHLR
jgi:hypothetical protein